MPTDLFAVNGRIVTAAEATVSVLDLGFLRGVGAFETLRTYAGGLPHALGEHLRRLWESAGAFGLSPCFSDADARALIARLHQQSGHQDIRVNLVVTPGVNTTGVFGADSPTWVFIARDVHAPPESSYADGVAAVTFDATRHLPSLKTTNYLVGKAGIQLAERSGAHEALYVTSQGYVTEGVTSNVLIVKGARVMTPVLDCLAGITKAGIRPLVVAHGLEWYECNLTRDDLYTADEVWISSAVREIMPVVRVDGRAIQGGAVGRWAKTLRGLYRESCINEARRDADLARSGTR